MKDTECSNTPLPYLEILKLAYWGASCFEDDFLYLVQTKTKGKKQNQRGLEKCQRQMAFLKEEIAKYERIK